MALNRLSGLGIALGTSMLVALACDSGGTTSNPGGGFGQGGGGNNDATGGANNNGSTGGASSANTKATGGAIGSSTGGAKATTGGAGTASTGQPANCASLTPPTGSGTLSVTSGYVTTGTYKGYGFTWVGDKSNSDTCITPKCDTTGCKPSFGASSLCAAGVVAMDAEYNSIIGVGFNLDQAQSGSNDPKAVTAGSTITVDATMGTGTGDAAARIQIVDDAGTNYCVDSGTWSSGSPIDIASFNTTCWDNKGSAPSTSTKIVSVHIVVPSDATADRPFSFCLTGFSM
jgi:hypothetical protein